MAFGKLIGLAAVGGLLYAHKRRGGQFTVESFTQSARDLMQGAKTRAQDYKSMAEKKLGQTANQDEDLDLPPVNTGSYGTSGQDFGIPKPDKGY